MSDDLPPESRVTDAISKLGAEHAPSPDWQQRVLNATVDRAARRAHIADFLIGAGVMLFALAIIVAVAWWFLRPAPSVEIPREHIHESSWPDPP